MIVVIGYGFGDEHINGILGQALKKSNNKKVSCIGPNIKKENIKKYLKINNDSLLEIDKEKAKDYFKDKLSIKEFEKLFPEEEDYFRSIWN